VAANGLETATFTVCARIRPVLPREEGLGGASFRVVFPGARNPLWRAQQGSPRSSFLSLLAPKISFKNEPQLDPTVFTLDHVFSDVDSEQEIYDLVGAPLVRRALDARTGVIFAYGQTGSGKTHTMNHIMDRMAVDLCADLAARPVRFSYLEILGNELTDTLWDGSAAPAAAEDKGAAGAAGKHQHQHAVKMGEAESGAVELRGLGEHNVTSADHLLALIARAKAKRCVAATEMNGASSRSHGVALFTVGRQPRDGVQDGKLYVIDLAGSENSKDLQKHDRARMNETKKINVSLNALKECIQVCFCGHILCRISCLHFPAQHLSYLPTHRTTHPCNAGTHARVDPGRGAQHARAVPPL
jgi:kinesin family protein 2/24